MRLITFFGCFAVVSAQSFVTDMLSQINKERTAEGVASVCLSPQLTKTAQTYADLQASLKQGGHYAGGQTPQDRVGNLTSVAENLFEGYQAAGSSSAVVANTELMRDAPDRANIINSDYTHVGIGRAYTEQQGQQYYYWVQFFAKMDDLCSPSNPLGAKTAKSLPEQLAPTEKSVVIRQTINETVPGGGGMERVEQVEKTYLDTVPRIDESGWTPDQDADDEDDNN